MKSYEKVICVVEDEKAINDLVNQYLKKKAMRFVPIIRMKRPVPMSVTMMYTYGSWISCWMIRAGLT